MKSDSANHPTQQTFADTSTSDYTYDKIGQLKIADSSVNNDDRGYVYDTAWNLTRRTNAQDALYVDTLTVDHLDQLTNAYTYNSQGNHDATYDANGNLTMTSISYGASIDSYFYDDENRLQYLVHSQSGQPLNWWNSPQSAYDRITHLTYDGLGRLRQRVEYAADEYGSSWSAGVETRYIYDGWRVIQERDGSNVPTVAYTRGTDLSGSLEGAGGIGALLARSHGYSAGNWSMHNFYHADGNGNITYLVNSSQTVAASYRYDPYGNTISSSGSLASDNTYRFSSKMIFATSGIYYYGYRWYDPNLQRWLNRDPIQEKGGINLYTFANNDPPNDYDPFGDCTDCEETTFPDKGTFKEGDLIHRVSKHGKPSTLTFKVCCPFGKTVLEGVSLTSTGTPPKSQGEHKFPDGWGKTVSPTSGSCFEVVVEVPTRTEFFDTGSIKNVRVTGQCCKPSQ